MWSNIKATFRVSKFPQDRDLQGKTVFFRVRVPTALIDMKNKRFQQNTAIFANFLG